MPRHEHDCSKCKPLGEFGEFDLYYCETDLFKNPTVIARFGSDGDYTAGLNLADRVPELAEARKRAIEAGYMSR
jgi:hypothetical protein